MKTATSMARLADMSPKAKARLAGLFFLLTIVGGVFAQIFVSDKLVVSGDAAATANNILTQQSLFRLGFAVYLVEMACQIAMTVFFYDLLKPVNKSVSLMALAFGLVGCTIKILARLFYYAPLLVLSNAQYLRVFDADQVQALALLFLNVNEQAAAIALVFFGFNTLLTGYLVIRSTFLPRALGVITAAGGLGWLAFLSPPLGMRLFVLIALIGLLGSVAKILWLLVFGVNEQRWKEQASAATDSIWR